MAFEHVKAGDKFAPKAFEFNAMLDAGSAFLNGNNQRLGGGLESGANAPVWVWVKNATGGDLDRYQAITIGNPLWTLDASHNLRSVVFEGIDDDDAKPIGILQQPLKDGRIGRAVLQGVTLAKVVSGSTTEWQADLGGTANTLEPSAGGRVRLLRLLPSAATHYLPVWVSQLRPGIIDLRLSGTALQYTFDGTNWTTWHTGTECAE